MFKKLLVLFLCTSACSMAMRELRLNPSGLERVLDLSHGASFILPFLTVEERFKLMQTSQFCAQQIKKSYAEINTPEKIGDRLLTLENKDSGEGFFELYQSWCYNASKAQNWMQDLAQGSLRLRLLRKGPAFLDFSSYATLTPENIKTIQDTELPIFCHVKALAHEALWPQIIGLTIVFESAETFLEETTDLLKRFKAQEKRRVTLFLVDPEPAQHMPEETFSRLLEVVEEADIGPIRSLTMRGNTHLFTQCLQKQQQFKDLVAFESTKYFESEEDQHDGTEFLSSLNQLERLTFFPLTLLYDIKEKNINMKYLKTLHLNQYLRVYHRFPALRNFLITLPKTTLLSGDLELGGSGVTAFASVLEHFTNLSKFNLNVEFSCSYLSYTEFYNLLEGLNKHPEMSLQCVGFQFNGFRGAPMSAERAHVLINKLPQNTSILTLTLSPQNFDVTVDALQNLEHIKSLDIFFDCNDDPSNGVYHFRGLEKLLGVLKTYSSLKSLSLYTQRLSHYVDASGELVALSQDVFKKHLFGSWPELEEFKIDEQVAPVRKENAITVAFDLSLISWPYKANRQ